MGTAASAMNPAPTYKHLPPDNPVTNTPDPRTEEKQAARPVTPCSCCLCDEDSQQDIVTKWFRQAWIGGHNQGVESWIPLRKKWLEAVILHCEMNGVSHPGQTV